MLTISDKLKRQRDYLDEILNFPFNMWSSPFSVLDSLTENDDDTASLSLDVPGIQSKDIDISIDKNIITVKGERKDNKKQRTINTSFTLPAGYNPDSIEAVLEDGVMTLSFTKMPLDKNEVKKIAVQSVKSSTSTEVVQQ